MSEKPKRELNEKELLLKCATTLLDIDLSLENKHRELMNELYRKQGCEEKLEKKLDEVVKENKELNKNIEKLQNAFISFAEAINKLVEKE